MTLTAALGIVAGSVGVVMGASPLLQAWRTHQRRSGADVSLPFILVLCGGAIAWLAYGIALGNVVLIVANSVGFTCSGATILVTLRWRRIEGRER